MKFFYNDGGRKAAGYEGLAGDCTVRAIAIALNQPYQHVYDELFHRNKLNNPSGKGSPRNGGTNMKTIKAYLEECGWEWIATMGFGTGCKVHLKVDELPNETIICRVSKHLCAVIDGVIHDTHNPSREGTRCVYGYWRRAQ